MKSTGFATFQAFTQLQHAKILAMGSARKPVIVRKFSREWYAGYAGAAFGQDSAALEVLDLSGKVLTIGWETVKWVCYVRDFSSTGDPSNPERLLQKRFAVRIAHLLILRWMLSGPPELAGPGALFLVL